MDITFSDRHHIERLARADVEALIAEREDTIPHCTSCDDNPATEDSDLCLPCAQARDARCMGADGHPNCCHLCGAWCARDGQWIAGDAESDWFVCPTHYEQRTEELRDAQPVRQENDAWGNRGGNTYRPSDEQVDDIHCACGKPKRPAQAACDRCLYGEGGEYMEWSEQIAVDFSNDDRALYQRMDDGYRKQAFVARASALVGAFLLALSLGSASAADYTPTAPIGCTITHYWAQDDMSAIAVCAGGYTIHKEAGPIDDWNDIPVAVDTLVLTDTQGGQHDWAVLD